MQLCQKLQVIINGSRLSQLMHRLDLHEKSTHIIRNSGWKLKIASLITSLFPFVLLNRLFHEIWEVSWYHLLINSRPRSIMSFWELDRYLKPRDVFFYIIRFQREETNKKIIRFRFPNFSYCGVSKGKRFGNRKFGFIISII